MKDFTASFIKQTAKDYEIEIEIVESIYKGSITLPDFYERIEEYNSIDTFVYREGYFNE